MKIFSVMFFVCMHTLAFAQKDLSKVEIITTKVSDHMYMLEGAGGNIGVFAGLDGVYVIDDQYAPLSKKIAIAINKFSKKKVVFVVNTHWHGDHTGGNEALGKNGAIVVAHNNVRKRMNSEQFIKLFERKVEKSPVGALPIVTFNSEMTLHVNGDAMQIIHVNNAHTDGDAFVWLAKENVLHMGDVFFNGIYPFIDLSSGGSVKGLIIAVEKAMGLINDKTKIIPGHGSLAGKKELSEYLKMLKDVAKKVSSLKAKKLSLKEVQDKKPTEAYDEKLGGGFIKPDTFVKILYQSL